MATEADAIALIKGYGTTSKGDLSPILPSAVAYWKAQIEALGWEGARDALKLAAANYYAPAVITDPPLNRPLPASATTIIDPKLLLIGAIAVYFLFFSKD